MKKQPYNNLIVWFIFFLIFFFRTPPIAGQENESRQQDEGLNRSSSQTIQTLQMNQGFSRSNNVEKVIEFRGY